MACTLQPLTEVLKSNLKVLVWSTDVQVSFAAIKDALVEAMPLAHPLPHAELSLATDASDTHIGGVLQQQEVKGWRPLGFFSKKLSSTECKYSALTGSCWPPSPPSTTSGMLWRAASSSFGPTTSRCWRPFTESLNVGHPGSSSNYHSLLNVQLVLSTCRGCQTL